MDIDINIDEQIEDLDISWIEEFDKTDNDYKIYYPEEISFIKLHYIYINRNNEILKIKEEKYILNTPSILSKEELLGIIKHNSFLNEIKYSLFSILKYNINIEPINLKTFLKNNNTNLGEPFLQSIKNIISIHFDKSINMFHDLNEIIIIFQEKSEKILNEKTRKLYSIKNIKKTKRKQVKDITI